MAIELGKIKSDATVSPKVKSKSAWTEMFNMEISFGNSFGDKKKEQFYSDLFTLFEAGMDLRSSLDLLISEQVKKKDRELLTGIRDQVIRGNSFSEALQKTGLFNAYEYYGIKIGEETGKLPDILHELMIYYTKRISLKRQLIKVLTYPAFVLSVSGGVIYFMLKYIVPMFADVFKRFGNELPPLTQKVIVLSDAVANYGIYFLLGIIGIIFSLYLNRNKIWYRKASSAVIVRIPFFGPLIKKVYLARFCQSMQLLVASRTSLVEAIDLTAKMIGFYPIEESLQKIRGELVKGKSLHESMQKFTVYDRKLISLIKVAEEVNQLDTMFDKLSKQYSDDVEHRTGTIGSIVEPLMIILIGLVVGFILIAMYLPLFNLGGAIE
jgi:type IV pilus assembly protein PilC